MKKLVTLVALASLFAAPALALPDEGPDSYGIYFMVDDNYVNQVMDIAPNTFVPTYVILAGITRPSVGGWEVAFAFEPLSAGAVIGTTFQGDAQNFSTPPSFIVGLGTPLPTPAEGYLVLAEMNVLFFAGVMEWYGGPTDPASIEGVPAYANGEDVADLVGCYFSTDADGQFLDDEGWTTHPVAAVNLDAPVATENASWSNVKNLY